LGIAGEGGEPFADVALRQALRFQDRFHPAVEVAALVEAHLVDRVGGQVRAGRILQQPGVVGVALRQFPGAGVGRGLRADRGKRRDLAVERGVHAG
jgi:hypothetical protein